MTPCTRPPCPDWLSAHCEAWGAEYASKRAAALAENKSPPQFNWKQWQGQRVNLRLLPLLRPMTRGHCAYCDWFPMDAGTDPTIDHFRPKALFPEDAYTWENLYLCCRTCQERDDANYCDDLLRPDEPGYSFERYFVYNYRDGTIAPNPRGCEHDRARAAFTRDHFKLNEGGRPAARQRELRRFRDLEEAARGEWIEETAFRYLLLQEIA